MLHNIDQSVPIIRSSTNASCNHLPSLKCNFVYANFYKITHLIIRLSNIKHSVCKAARFNSYRWVIFISVYVDMCSNPAIGHTEGLSLFIGRGSFRGRFTDPLTTSFTTTRVNLSSYHFLMEYSCIVILHWIYSFDHEVEWVLY